VCEVEDEHTGEVIEAVTLRKGEVRAIRGSTQLLLYALFLLERHFGLQLMWLRSCQPKEVATIALPLDAEAAAEAAVDGRIGLSAHLQACLLSFSLSPVPCAAASAPPPQLLEMLPLEGEGRQRLVFEAPARGLIGFRAAFAAVTRGTGVLHRAFSRWGACAARAPCLRRPHSPLRSLHMPATGSGVCMSAVAVHAGVVRAGGV
jgi:hypothetical protein